jgi:putative glutamine amidotransferase
MSSAGSARRPLIVIPARFSQSASALRFRAEVSARSLLEAVYAAGGEPVVIHPSAPGAVVDRAAVRERIGFAAGVVLPGGGDVSARWSGGGPHASLYDVDEEQDAFDLAVAEVALADGLPLLSICRGTQIVNVALGGTLVADMAETVGGDHRHRVHDVDVDPHTTLGSLLGPRTTISCYHHQCIDHLADSLEIAATATDGVIEAVTLRGAEGGYLGVQWHPEDTAATDPRQASLFGRMIDLARARVSVPSEGPALGR